MDLLKRQLAPITEPAWALMEQQADLTIKANLSARRLVDFNGPHGWDYSALNLGRLDLAHNHTPDGVYFGLRKVQPLVELRIPFQMKTMELDCASRGAADIDFTPLINASATIARFEENAVYNGFKDGGILGMLKATTQKHITLSSDGNQYPGLVAQALNALRIAGIGGPYALVLGSDPYQSLAEASGDGYPALRRVERLLGGPVLWSPVLEGGVLLSTRGGDFELTIGQDFSIGYAAHDRTAVELYLAESFTFRVLEPEALVAFALKKKN